MNINVLFEKCDALLISSPHNLRYFSGFAGGEGYCVLSPKSKSILVDSRYTVEAKRECPEFEVIEFGGGNLYELLKKLLERDNVKTLGYEDLYMTVSEYDRLFKKLDNVSAMPMGAELESLRSIKTESEINLLREAEKIGDMAFKEVLPLIKTGMTENELAAEIEYRMRKLGASGTSFETIAVSGKRSAMPHGKPSEKKLEHGDFVTMDFGCVYKGYCSDMTRTVVMCEASEKQIEIYNTVLKAQLAGLDAIASGVCARDADGAARRVIEDAGYGECFGHSLGHGVGLLIHEQPSLSARSDVILKENMVVTCEPGIYVSDFGGVRIEDMVVVGKGGCENLTSSDKKLFVCD